jgi:predicted metal-binding protein
MTVETANGVTVFVCVTCEGPDDEAGGQRLFQAVDDRVRAGVSGAMTVTPVECLAVCRRPSTVALSGVGKWTCVVGDLDAARNADDVIAAALAYAASETGIIPWRERPVSFRKGVVARIPPLGFRPDDDKKVV